MRITEQNIDQWLNDYESGRLTTEETTAAALILESLIDDPAITVADEKADDLSVEIKTSLVRGFTDLNSEQKQILAIAKTEGDLNHEELIEFETLLSRDKDIGEELEMIKRTRLSPINNELYQNKGSLKRSTALISPKLYYTISSIAAILIIAFFTGRFLDGPSQTELPAIELLSEQTTIPVQPVIEEMPIAAEGVISNSPVRAIPVLAAASPVTTPADPEPIITRSPMDKISPLTLSGTDIPAGNNTIAYSTIIPVQLMAVASPSPYGEERSALKERFAEAFRSMALGEERPTRDPLTPFEIAGAGLNGVNKLFGWNMELARESLDGGDQEVIAFNSKLIKVNAPKKVAD